MQPLAQHVRLTPAAGTLHTFADDRDAQGRTVRPEVTIRALGVGSRDRRYPQHQQRGSQQQQQPTPAQSVPAGSSGDSHPRLGRVALPLEKARDAYVTPPHRPPASPPARVRQGASAGLLSSNGTRGRELLVAGVEGRAADVDRGGGGLNGLPQHSRSRAGGGGPSAGDEDEEDESLFLRAGPHALAADGLDAPDLSPSAADEDASLWGEDDVTAVLHSFGIDVGGSTANGAGGVGERGGEGGWEEVDEEAERDEALLARAEAVFRKKFEPLPANTWGEVVQPILEDARAAHEQVDDHARTLLSSQRALVDLAEMLCEFLAGDGEVLCATYQEFATRKETLIGKLQALEAGRGRRRASLGDTLRKLADERRAAHEGFMRDLSALEEQYRKQAGNVASERESGKEVNRLLKEILGNDKLAG